MPRAIFRVFLSSTFGDFQSERESLRGVWNRLEQYCAAHGASFHLVDLRWGISPSLAHNHNTIQICLDEVRRCQKLSPKPNFIMLIGDRYGWRPPSATLPDNDFTLIREALSPDDATFFLSWYRRDNNEVPPVWRLKPREGEFLDQEAWQPVESRISTILHEVATSLALPPESYQYSATHREISAGLLTYDGAREHVFSFNREIIGLSETVSSKIARRFADYGDDGIRDADSVRLLKELKRQIASILPEDHLHSYEVDWQGDESGPIALTHLDRLSINVETALQRIIGAELQQMIQTTPLEEELSGQEAFLHETGTLLIGRDRELRRITGYLNRKKTGFPLILHAPGGAGNQRSWRGLFCR